jgi:hypothetical protein
MWTNNMGREWRIIYARLFISVPLPKSIKVSVPIYIYMYVIKENSLFIYV